MLLVMMIHIGVQEPVPNLYAAKVPLFFILSGFFLKDDGAPFSDTLLKSFKRLLVPFIFFYVLSYVVFYAGCYAYPPMREMTEAQGILDCFTQKQYFNGPLWFLLCLFFVQVIVKLGQRLVQQEWIRTLVCAMLGVCGYVLSKIDVDLPLTIDTALVAVPMFWIGHYLNRIGLFVRENIWKTVIPVCIVVYLLTIITPPHVSVSMSVNRYSVNILFLYLISITFSVLIVYLCKWFLAKDRVTPYIGRNSLLILCTHHMIYRPVSLVIGRFVGQTFEPYITLVITLFVCLALIPLFDRQMPWAVGKWQTK